MNPGDAPRLTLLDAVAKHLVVLYATTVREIRNASGSSQLGLILNLLQTLAFVAVFYVLFIALGRRDAGLRGDPMMFMLTGVLLFRMHVSVVSGVISSVKSNRALINYEPAKSIIFVWARALADLYVSLLVAVILVSVTALIKGGVEIYYPAGVIVPTLLAWLSAVGIGLIFMYAEAHISWFSLVSRLYQRFAMFTSGKFFVANAIPTVALAMFWWNPLFHAIDILRGAVFVNYEPKKTSLEFLIGLTVVALVVGHMLEARLHRSLNSARN